MLKIIPPSKDLSAYVAYYYIAELNRGKDGSTLKELCLPSGYTFMGFQTLGRCHFILNGQKIVPERFYYSGQVINKYYLLSDDPSIANVGVAFKPTGLWHLFGLDLGTLVDKVLPNRFLFKDELVSFTEQFDAQKSYMDKKDCIESLLLTQLKKAAPILNLIDSAVELIQENHGCLPIHKVAAKLKISNRYFQKKFKNMVGIAPSVYSRIVRFNYLFAEMNPDGPKDYKSLAAFYNYYDFPHFSKDFKKYCGAAPSKFHIDKFHFLKEFMINTPIGIPPQ